MQVATFVTRTVRTPQAVRDGLNARLPAEIACLSAEPVHASFDPRRDPHTKTYRYTWLISDAPRPLRRGRAWRSRRQLDVQRMAESVLCLIGTHDFTSFRAAGCSATHPVRTIMDATVVVSGDEVHLRLLGTGFLRHMVRIVAGSVHEIGQGRQEASWLREVLEARDRGRAGRTAPAQGLLLERIVYDA